MFVCTPVVCSKCQEGGNSMHSLHCNSKFAFSEEVIGSNKFNFKTQIMQNNIYVFAPLDFWIISRAGKNTYNLFHENKKFGREGSYHFQEKFESLEKAFKYIAKHNNYLLKYKWIIPLEMKKAYIEVTNQKRRKNNTY